MTALAFALPPDPLSMSSGPLAGGGVSAFVIRHVMDLGHRLGVGREPLMAQARVTETDLNPADGWVRQDALARLLRCSLDHWRDPVVTLRVVLSMEPAMMGVLGYLMQCCPTLMDMQQAVTDFGLLVSSLHGPYLLHEPGAALWCVAVRSHEPDFVRHSEEGFLALHALLISRQMPDALLAVRFRHGPVLVDGEPHPLYRRAFPCPVLFHQPHSALVVNPQALNQPLPLADLTVFDTLRQRARDLMQQLGAQPRLADRVKESLRKLLVRGVSSREAVADSLGMSARHLSRQLHAQGDQYQSILDGLRAELAHHALVQPVCDLEDLAMRLDFSSAGAFARWFRTRTGVTPAEFRRGVTGRG